MQVDKSSGILTESIQIESKSLDRSVQIDFYLPVGGAGESFYPILSEKVSLLLINDGQELEQLGLADMLDVLYGQGQLVPLLCVGIHAGPERKLEYGTAGIPDYKGWGARAAEYNRFVLDELIPFIREKFRIPDFKEKAFAGFSLGALSAMDIVWNHPQEFAKAGLFSGSFWWRTKDKTDPAYRDEADRIMHRKVREREGGYYPWLKFFFECGTEDEREDRNGNGIIDSIDDTQDLIGELIAKGYTREANGSGNHTPGVGGSGEQDSSDDIHYLEIEGGKHDVATWARAMPAFLEWGWGRE